MRDTNPPTPHLTTQKLMLIAGGLCLLGILIAAYPSAMFFKNIFVDVVFPIQKFDANTETVLDLPDSDTRYLIAVAVNEPRGEVPPVELTLSADTGEVESTESYGWISNMGHYYRLIRIVSPAESQTITVTAQTDAGEDLIVYRHHTDAIRHRGGETAPWWIAGVVPFLAGFGLVLFVLCRMACQKDQIKLDL